MGDARANGQGDSYPGDRDCGGRVGVPKVTAAFAFQ